MGHDFEGSDSMNQRMVKPRPEGHGSADQKYDKGMRSPWLSQFPMGGELVSPEVDEGVSGSEGGM